MLYKQKLLLLLHFSKRCCQKQKPPAALSIQPPITNSSFLFLAKIINLANLAECYYTFLNFELQSSDLYPRFYLSNYSRLGDFSYYPFVGVFIHSFVNGHTSIAIETGVVKSPLDI